MNAFNGVTLKQVGLKVFVCGAAALMIALACSYTFVDANKVLTGTVAKSLVASAGFPAHPRLAQGVAADLLQ